MRIALLSDIHGNLQALQACLADARARGAERYAFLGDLAGYGADPHCVIDLVREHVEQGAIAVRGNHDEASYGSTAYLNEFAQIAIEYGRGVLSAGQIAFLRELPLLVREDGLCFVHGSAAAPEKYPYVDSPTAAARCADAADAAHTFCGHVHEQRLYHAEAQGRMRPFRPTVGVAIPLPSRRRWVALVGSVGQPRDGKPSAAYALFDTAPAAITYCRVAYDHRAAAARIREAGLPEFLAERVEHGY
jgi:diadenosine tetraphosphatase ApaH/serine/threonine PP2A family protein phosphatase